MPDLAHHPRPLPLLVLLWLSAMLLLAACAGQPPRLRAHPTAAVALSGDWVLDRSRSEVADASGPGVGEWPPGLRRPAGQRPRGAGLGPGTGGPMRGPGHGRPGQGRRPGGWTQRGTGDGLLTALRAAERLSIQVDGSDLRISADERPLQQLRLGAVADADDPSSMTAGWDGTTLVVQRRLTGPQGRERTVTERYALSAADGSLRLSTELAAGRRARVLQRVYVRAAVD